MTITLEESSFEQTCWRCQRPIPAEEKHYVVTSGDTHDRSCTECFERLRRAVAAADKL